MARDARGRFVKGPDPARHALTAAERRAGYAAAMAHPDPAIVAWVFRKLRKRRKGLEKARGRRYWQKTG